MGCATSKEAGEKGGANKSGKSRKGKKAVNRKPREKSQAFTSSTEESGGRTSSRVVAGHSTSADEFLSLTSEGIAPSPSHMMPPPSPTEAKSQKMFPFGDLMDRTMSTTGALSFSSGGSISVHRMDTRDSNGLSQTSFFAPKPDVSLAPTIARYRGGVQVPPVKLRSMASSSSTSTGTSPEMFTIMSPMERFERQVTELQASDALPEDYTRKLVNGEISVLRAVPVATNPSNWSSLTPTGDGLLYCVPYIDNGLPIPLTAYPPVSEEDMPPKMKVFATELLNSLNVVLRLLKEQVSLACERVTTLLNIMCAEKAPALILALLTQLETTLRDIMVLKENPLLLVKSVRGEDFEGYLPALTKAIATYGEDCANAKQKRRTARQKEGLTSDGTSSIRVSKQTILIYVRSRLICNVNYLMMMLFCRLSAIVDDAPDVNGVSFSRDSNASLEPGCQVSQINSTSYQSNTSST